jgi:drug/metabolite transporter (DMT)-like permease
VFYSSLIGSLLLFWPATYDGSLSGAWNYSVRDWLSIAYLGLLGTAMGFTLYYGAIRRIGASRAGVFINLVPFFSICLSWPILGESVKISVFIGGLILLAGVALTNMHPGK